MRPRPKKNRISRYNAVQEYLATAEKNENCTTPEIRRRTGEGRIIDINASFPAELNDSPLNLEIGCGKGAFITEISGRNPNSRYIALELAKDVMLMAMEKCMSEKRQNVKFYNCDACIVDSVLPPASVDALYLNFSDPWPKARCAKRRLTSRNFLQKYKTILKPGAKIFFKTDNRELFDFSLEEFEAEGFKLENVCFDLHSSVLAANNIETEYEKNFSAKGFTINYLEAHLEQNQ